jgi:hypothetical protein
MKAVPSSEIVADNFPVSSFYLRSFFCPGSNSWRAYKEKPAPAIGLWSNTPSPNSWGMETLCVYLEAAKSPPDAFRINRGDLEAQYRFS